MAEANVFFPKDPNEKPFLSYSYGGKEEVWIPTRKELGSSCDTKSSDTIDVEVRAFERVLIYTREDRMIYVYVEK